MSGEIGNQRLGGGRVGDKSNHPTTHTPSWPKRGITQSIFMQSTATGLEGVS